MVQKAARAGVSAPPGSNSHCGTELGSMDRIARILEFSADAHIKRHDVAKGSPEFHNLTGAIGAFGKALEVLIGLEESEECCTGMGSIPQGKMVARVG